MDIITKFIVYVCSSCQVLLSYIVYGFMFFRLLKVGKRLWFYDKKLNYVDEVIGLINKTGISDDNKEEGEKKLEIITSNFPIMVQEIKDVYNKRKPKQISAIDLFENNLVISSSDEIIFRTWINSFTSLGLLGTFIGLVSSVLKISPEQTSEGITALLTSIGPAISTTIVGVLCSLFASHWLSSIKAKYKNVALKLENEMMQDKPSDTNPDYFYDSFTSLTGEKYEIALGKIVDNFIEHMREALTNDLEEYKKVINDSIINLCKNEEKFNAAAIGLESTIENINVYLQRTDELNKNFEIKLKEFTDALDDFNIKFKNSNEFTGEVLEKIETINKSTSNINSSLYDVLKLELNQIQKSFELMKEMNDKFRKEIMNTPMQINNSIGILCQNINAFSSKMEAKMRDISDKLNRLS